jgi:hypothetical protein
MRRLIYGIRTYLPMLLVPLLIALATAQVHTDALVEDPVTGLYPSPNERFGFGVTTDINDYDVGQLHAGWYVNWGASPQAPHPAGLRYVQIIRVCDDAYRNCGGKDYRPNGTELASIVSANPGDLWLVGNEPDCVHQDSTRPEAYAGIYHDVYEELKRLDATAQVGIGGVVQATPLRMEWVERVWQEYQLQYGDAMPVDVWNVHTFTLREVRYDQASDTCYAPVCAPPGAQDIGCWGCDIPPGASSDCGLWIDVDDHDRIDLLDQHVRAFREWMRDKGQQDKPLIVSEYGILMNEQTGYPYERVRDFMLATFDYFLTATDPDIGYPSDGNRLVQQWAWFSLDWDNFEWGATRSNLFDPTSKEIELLGQDFADYILGNDLIVPYQDVEPVTLTLDATYPPLYSQPLTLTLRSQVVNWGNSSTGPFAVSFWDDERPLGQSTAFDLGPRYEGRAVVEVSWSDPFTQPHTYRIVADPADQVDEWKENNNEASIAELSVRDLQPITLTLQPEGSLVYGQPSTLTLRSLVVNWGNTPTDPFLVTLSDTGKTLGECAIPEGLGPRPEGQALVEISWTDPLTAPHSFSALADSGSEVDEWKESNNEATLELDIDLALVQLRARAPLVEPGQTGDITVTATISNPGDVAFRDLTLELRDGMAGEIITTTVSVELEPGVERDVSLLWPDRSGGPHQIVAVVDPENRIAESNEENNESQYTMFLTSRLVHLSLMARNGIH